MDKRASRAEQAGWAGLCVVDSQCLAPDSYVALTVAALATERLGLGTGVTNSITRHPAVTASAAAALQRVAGPRVEIGIGRGDSALAHLGRAPDGVRHFERYVETLQRYLRGERIPFDELGFGEEAAPEVGELGLADTPSASRLNWIPEARGGDGAAKVLVEVASTGPRVIGIAARHADRVMFTLGASVERLSWGLEVASKAAPGRAVRHGAFVNLVCHPDASVARELVRGGLTTFARFAVMHGDVSGPVDDEQRRILESLHAGYDMKRHTRSDSSQAELMTPDFIDRYAIAGPPDLCIQRMKELEALGLDKLIVTGPTAGSDPAKAREAIGLLEREVLPALAA
jgi:5,10-methylenetetrahydromethanopterin reductase